MEITLEQVERLREKADVSYGQAKAALEYSGGNLLDALIYLEEQGVIPRPEDLISSILRSTLYSFLVILVLIGLLYFSLSRNFFKAITKSSKETFPKLTFPFSLNSSKFIGLFV